MNDPFPAPSALDPLWCPSECCRSPLARRFLDELDLGPARDLVARGEAAWQPWGEGVRDRAFAVRRLVDRCLGDVGGPRQVVIVGPGMTPLGIDLKAAAPYLLVFEVDKVGMPLKERKVAALGDANLKDIRFVEADLADAETVRRKLLIDGLDPVERTLLVAENVSPFLSRKALKDLVDIVRMPCLSSRVVLAFIREEDGISAEQREIPSRILGLLAKSVGFSQAERYRAADFASWPWTTLLERLLPEDIERLRTGRNERFTSESSGWLEVCLLAV